MSNLFGFETNLKQLAIEEFELGMELFHKLGDGGIKSGLAPFWTANVTASCIAACNT